MRLLVIGGCGFVGSNFVRYVLQHYGPEMITNVDALTTGRLANLDGVAALYGDRYEFFRADFADVDKMNAVLEKHHFFGVIHFAAESPGNADISTLLESARRHGVRRFLLVSARRGGQALALAEKAALAAYRDHGQEVIVTRSSDNYGPFQAPTEFVPQLILQALRNETVLLPNGGRRTRDWLHVEDHCAALFTALLDGSPGAGYPFVSGSEWSDVELAHRVLDQLGKSRDFLKLDESPVADGLPTLAEGIRQDPLPWKPRYPLEQGLRETIAWYVRNTERWERFANR